MAALPPPARLEPSPFRPGLDGLVTTPRNCPGFRPPGRQRIWPLFGNAPQRATVRHSAPNGAWEGPNIWQKFGFRAESCLKSPGIAVCCKFQGEKR